MFASENTVLVEKVLHNKCISAVAISLRRVSRGPWASCFHLLLAYCFSFQEERRLSYCIVNCRLFYRLKKMEEEIMLAAY